MPLPRPFALLRNAMLIAALGLVQPVQAQTLTPEQMFNRGVAYFHGDGVAQNDGEAVRWFRAAAAAGDARGMTILGFMYYEGRGVAQSDSEAVRWYRPAAAAGEATGMTNLGFMYESGRGVAQSDSEAVRWYRPAAAAGNAQGMTNLGLMYTEGHGVAQSDSEAVRWYRAAAAAGNAGGMYNLGWMYDQGRAVARDPGISADWVLQSRRGYAVLSDDPTDLSPDTLRVIQRALQNAGYYTGALDGVFGPASLAALNAFDNR